ncbi:MAG: molybdopterin-dependent oxidoreductase, partial [Proteobacteria bacterium]|nr:molybdopterin-dependent oxidoreductase [Pseudomonadota bacterium]
MSEGGEEPNLIGKIKDKLIRSKEKWAQEGRLLTGHSDNAHRNRLPPGQKEVKNWPVLDLGVQPAVKPQNWRLQVLGLVDNPVALTLPQFRALPQTEITSDIHCVTAWSLYDNRWQGVSSRTLLDLVRPRADARHIVFHSYDGYTTNVTLGAFGDDDVLLAHSWNGLPITREHGGPVRVVMPQWYFWKSAKWVTRIVFHTEDRP